MDRFRELSTFLAVAEGGAFNIAARRLHISPPSVTRAVTALEARLGVRLFTRTTRQVALTEAGERLRGDAQRILADLDEAEASATGAHDAPRGELRITAPVLFGRQFIAPILRDYLNAYPAVTARALFVDRVVDLIDEGFDVALRIGDLPDSSLIATRVGAVRRVVVAAPEYVARCGDPHSPEALRGHRIIVATGLGDAPIWEFKRESERRSVRLAPSFTVNALDIAIDAAVAGWGVTRVLSYQVADALASGALIEMLSDWEDRRMPIHLVHSEGRRAAGKIRMFIDFAATRLRGEPECFLARML